ncbi:MAG: hypothetical protein L6R39_000085 [Caloplaca ligustica]|nr:MAG: hypothetical protein L6R39_000085 [Caloplaca ligustica]
MHANKITQLLAVVTAVMFLALFHGLFGPAEPILGPRTGGFDDTVMDSPGLGWPTTLRLGAHNLDEQRAPERSAVTSVLAGSPPAKSNLSRIVVIPSMQEDDIKWIKTELPSLDVSIYIANNPAAPRHPPKNKGHEVMIYLTYLIDHYSRLPDIVLFMHSHRWTHHNNHLLGFDSSQMIRALNSAHVVREGYVNMRCHWSPGCPEWLRPTSAGDSLGKQEEIVLERCWRELFPFDQLPSFLAQPCCAQFALSRARILAIPRSRYIFYRDWILRTPLSDYISGRIWEYSWQYLFTGEGARCPAEHVCYCDGFGVCFGGEMPYKQYWELHDQRTKYAKELEAIPQMESANEGLGWQGDNGTNSISTTDSTNRRLFLRTQIAILQTELDTRKQDAQRRGANPQLRAEECGRLWKEGDGF